MKNLLFKSAIIVFIANFFFVGSTFAYLTDSESSASNTFSASSLDFSLLNPSDNTPITQLFSVTGLTPGDSRSMTAKINKEGSLFFQYKVTAVKTSGDDGLCNALKVRAVADGNELYDGNLLGLSISPYKLLSGTSDNWTFTVRLDDTGAELKNKNCNFNIVYRGWQISGGSTTGFYDVETLSNSVATGSWTNPGDVVINEVMWMGSVGDADDEWIELRNTTGSAIDLAGWSIDGAGAGSSAITIPSGTIQANEYFLITRKSIATSAIKDSITVDAVIPGMELIDGGEALTLKDSGSVSIDSTPIGTWPAGENGVTSKSMERNDDPSTGWHACVSAECNTVEFWDTPVGQNYGTPRSQNHSDESIKGVQKQESEIVCEGEKCLEVIIVPPVESEPKSDVPPTTDPTAEPTPGPLVEPTPTPEPSVEPTPTPEVVVEPTPEPEIVVEPATEPEAIPEAPQEEPATEEAPSEPSSDAEESQPTSEITILDLLKYFYA